MIGPATVLPERTKRPELLELLDALAKHGTKDQRSAAAHARTIKAMRASVLELAAQAMKRRRVHVVSLGWAMCKTEAGHDAPTLVERLTTPATTLGGEVTCAKCLELIGGELDADDQAAEDAEVAQAEAEAVTRRAREERRAARARAKAEAQAVEVAPVEELEPAPCEPTPIGLDDGHGTELGDPVANLTCLFPYKGTMHTGWLRADGRLELERDGGPGGETFPSPSAAGQAITGGAVNGWRRWRYVASDGLTYPIGRLRGDAVEPVRIGVTGRRPSKAKAIAKHAEALARQAKAAKRLAGARALVAELEAKHATATAQAEAAAASARALGVELEADDSDLFPVEGAAA